MIKYPRPRRPLSELNSVSRNIAHLTVTRIGQRGAKVQRSSTLLELNSWEPQEELTSGLSDQWENWGHFLVYCVTLRVLWFSSFVEGKQMEPLTLGIDKLKNKKYPPRFGTITVSMSHTVAKSQTLTNIHKWWQYVSIHVMTMTLWLSTETTTQTCNEGSKPQRKCDLSRLLKQRENSSSYLLIISHLYTSLYSHGYYSRSDHHRLSLELLQQPSNWSPSFLQCSPLLCGKKKIYPH